MIAGQHAEGSALEKRGLFKSLAAMGQQLIREFGAFARAQRGMQPIVGHR